jgi:hypothetical protein
MPVIRIDLRSPCETTVVDELGGLSNGLYLISWASLDSHRGPRLGSGRGVGEREQ